jgi:hypothetical protein
LCQQRAEVGEACRADLGGIEQAKDPAQGLLARDTVTAGGRVVGQAEGREFGGRGALAPLGRCGE